MAQDSTHWKVEGPSTAGPMEIIRYKLMAEDDRGYSKNVTDRVEASLSGPTTEHANVHNQGNGTFVVEAQPRQRGVYSLVVTVDGKEVFGRGRLNITIGDAPTSTKHIHFSMEGHGLAQARIGKSVSFTMDVQEGGRPYDVNESELSINIGSGARQFRANVMRIGSGKYNVEYVPQFAGTYDIDVIYDGKSVLTSPGNVVFSDFASSKSCIMDAPSRVNSNSMSQFLVQAKNQQGLNVKIGGDKFEVNVRGPKEPRSLEVKDHGTGQYTVSFLLPERGDYTFTLKVDGRTLDQGTRTITAV
mmetsp:Transcript_12830/g.14249  ORF Transcript_12830/g.14249 Transcript_12830/m.14249 type:complete len:301 (+) Transcript_12830:115-1017(+)